MPVLKHTAGQSASKSALVLDLSDLEKQAQNIIAAARQQADQIIAEARQHARQHADQAHDAASNKGYAAGLEKGLHEGREQGRQEAREAHAQQLGRIEQAWVQAAQSWDDQRQTMEQQAKAAVLDLAVNLARKVIHRTIEVDAAVVIDQLSHAMQFVLSPLDVAVHIHAEDRPVLEQAMPALAQKFQQARHVTLVDDPAVDRGGCLVFAGQGSVDARIQTQLDRLLALIIPEPSDQDSPESQTLQDDQADPEAPQAG